MKKYITALQEIGNIVGGPTMRYSLEIEKKELIGRMFRVSEIVQNVLRKPSKRKNKINNKKTGLHGFISD